MYAIRDAYASGLFAKKHWVPNIVSGIIVGIVALPLAMAFAIASGVKPEQGIYTAIFAGVIVSLFGGSRFQIAGPTGAFVVLLSGISSKYGVEGLQTASFMAGVMLLIFGLVKMGRIIKFIPAPVVVGFTAGIAVIIWVGQWKYFFGLNAAKAHTFHESFWNLIMAFPGLHLPTTLLACLSLAIVIFTPKIPKLCKIPSPVLALLAVSALQSIFQFEGVATIGTAFGGIPRGMPNFHVPDFTPRRLIELMGPAFTIAMLGSIESLLSAVVADNMTKTRHNSNQELVGQGLANILIPFFGGFAATGAIARTATNIRNGATGPLSGVVHSLCLILILIFLAPLAVNIPLCVLAAILFMVAWNMSERKQFIKMLKRAPRADVGILLVTFGLTIFTDLVVSVNIGVIIATLHFLNRMASSVELRHFKNEELNREYPEFIHCPIPPGVQIFAAEGPIFFGAVENFEKAISELRESPSLIIFRLRWVPFMDITGLQALEEFILDLKRKNIGFVLSGANGRVYQKLKNAGIIKLIGRKNYFSEFSNAYLKVTKQLQAVEPQV